MVRHVTKVAALIAVGLLAVSGAALATDDFEPKTIIEQSKSPKGEGIRHLARTFGGPSNGAAPIPLPMPVDPITPHGPSGKVSVASMAQGSGMSQGAIVGPRGGAISTPRQKADRAIHQLINRLY